MPVVLSFCTVFFLLATPGWADEALSGERDNHPYRLSLGSVAYTYVEPGVMSLNGRLTELDFSYRWQPFHTSLPLALVFGLDSFLGRTHYDGSISNLDTGVRTPVQDSSNERIFNLQGVFTAGFFESLEGAAGFAIWSLKNKVDGAASYTRDINYFYLPLSLSYQARAWSALRLSVGAQYNVFLFGTVESRLSEINPGNSDIHNEQTSGSGYKLRVAAAWDFPTWILNVELYIQQWNIADSNKVDVSTTRGMIQLWEPRNKTTMSGVNLGVQF